MVAVSPIVIPKVCHAVTIITNLLIISAKTLFYWLLIQVPFPCFSLHVYNNILTSMSVKLPLILKRELKPSPRRQSPPREEESPLRHSDPEENYEDQFEDEVQEEAEQEPPQAETITVLKKQQQEQLQSQLIHKEEPKVDLSKRKEELQKMLQQRMQQANALRESVSERKKQIKNIGQQIDRDLNRSLLKTAKQSTVSIRDIFSAPKPTSNKRINELNEELRNVRIAIKRIKTDISKISEGMMDPVTVLNQEKGVDFEARIRSSDDDLKRIQQEKDMLSDEIARGNKDFNEQQEKQRADQFAKLNAALTEVLIAQKQCKSSMNQLDREDILQMEKVKFFQERQGSIGQTKKVKQSEKDRMKMDEEVRQLILDINDTIEQRNKIQSQKKNHLKALNSDISSLQSKNWQLCNRLRQIDSFLLQYYEKKAKRKEAKLDKTEKQRSETVFDKSASGKIQVHSNFFQTPHATKTIEYDDKNKRSVPEVLSQRKKNYEFFSKQGEEGDLQLSDEFLGGKLNISKIIIIADQAHIYSLKVIYEWSQRQIEGLVIGGKNTPEEAKKIQIDFNRDFLEIINFMHIGFGQDHTISYFHIVTTQGREHKWGNADKSVKSDQKHIKKYEYCYLKGRVMQLDNSRFVLSGVTLSTIYLSAK